MVAVSQKPKFRLKYVIFTQSTKPTKLFAPFVASSGYVSMLRKQVPPDPTAKRSMMEHSKF